MAIMIALDQEQDGKVVIEERGSDYEDDGGIGLDVFDFYDSESLNSGSDEDHPGI